MNKQLLQVEEFQKFFKQPVAKDPGLHDVPKLLNRQDWLEEEVKELREALEAGDFIQAVDAMCDIQYILNGTILETGTQHIFETCFDEVHRSNMSKAGSDGQPILREDGKIVKGPNYFKPRLGEILCEYAINHYLDAEKNNI